MTALEGAIMVFLPMLMCALSLLQMILKLKRRVKELEAALEKEKQEENTEK